LGENSDSLHVDSYRIPEDVVYSLSIWEEVRIDINGHVDSVGTDRDNMTLSHPARSRYDNTVFHWPKY